MTSDQRITAALAALDRTMDGIEHRPRMYGKAPEALEAQVFQVVELRQVLYGYVDFDMHDALSKFIEALDVAPPPLFAALREAGRLAELPVILGDFARWVARKWPPIAPPAEAP